MQVILKLVIVCCWLLSLPANASAQVEAIFRKYPMIDPSGPDSSVIALIDDHGIRFPHDYKYYKGNNIPNGGYGLVFSHPVEMAKDTFGGRIDIRKAEFKTDVDFDTVLFLKNADFTYSFFNRDARFEYCQFTDTAHFCMTTFLGDADFSNAVFGHIAYFSGLTFGPQSQLSFTAAVLPDTLDFSENAVLPLPIELTDAHFTDGKVHHIFLNRTNIGMVHFDYKHFKLLFFDPKNDTTISGEEKESIYREALQNFKSRGQADSYQKLDIEYRHFLAKNSFEWIIDMMKLSWWNYGYWKWLVFLWAIFFVMLFSLINYFRLNELNKHVYTIDGILEFPKLGIQPFSWKRAKTRFWYSMVYTSNIFFRLTLDSKRVQFSKVRGSLYIFVIYIAGIICLAYMANFVLQK